MIDYLINQKEHHKIETFEDEFVRLLIDHGVEFNPKFLFD